eukprot:3252424-Rhodomonas_salina.4
MKEEEGVSHAEMQRAAPRCLSHAEEPRRRRYGRTLPSPSPIALLPPAFASGALTKSGGEGAGPWLSRCSDQAERGVIIPDELPG